MTNVQRRLFSCNGIQPRLLAEDLVPSTKSAGFSASDTLKIGCALAMTQCLQLITLGTTAARVGTTLRTTIDREHGRLPGTFDYLMIDAAPAAPGTDMLHFKQMPATVDGAGTLFERGHEIMFAAVNYLPLRANISNRVLRLFRGDPEIPTLSPRQSMDFLVIAGTGGTGGGGLHPLISLLHDIAQARHIAQPRVHVIIIGAEMMIHDKDRSVLPEQQQLIRHNAALNLSKILLDMATPGYLEEPRPDGTKFAVTASERVYSITLADHSNGYTDHATVAALTDMLADALYLRFFTPAGNYLSQRICDPRHIGIYCLGGSHAD